MYVEHPLLVSISPDLQIDERSLFFFLRIHIKLIFLATRLHRKKQEYLKLHGFVYDVILRVTQMPCACATVYYCYEPPNRHLKTTSTYRIPSSALILFSSPL